jgi:hypothetical protein
MYSKSSFSGSDVGAKYYGGELRHESSGKQAVVIVAAETSGLANPREAVALRLLQKILGETLYSQHFCVESLQVLSKRNLQSKHDASLTKAH